MVEFRIDLGEMTGAHARPGSFKEAAEVLGRHRRTARHRIEHCPCVLAHLLNIGHQLARGSLRQTRHTLEEPRGYTPREDIRRRLQQLVVFNRIRPIEDGIGQIESRVTTNEMTLLPRRAGADRSNH